MYIRFCLEQLINSTGTFLGNELFYIGPLRKSPSRSYVRTSHSLAVGPTGEHTPSVLANLEKKRIKATTGNSKFVNNHLLFNKWVSEIFPDRKVET
jgi:hypothetical protein